MARETQRDKITRLEAKAEELNNQNKELLEKLRITQNELVKKNTAVEENPLYIQMQGEMERYKLQFEEYKRLYQKVKSKQNEEHKANISLHEEIRKLKNENEELKQQRERKHNERGAGRKTLKSKISEISSEILKDILEDRNNGMTFKQLSAKYGYSVGGIHNLINELKDNLE